jgi:thioredoxin-related protein
MLERYKIFIILVALFMGQFLFAADNIWLTDLATAKKQSALKNLPILANFTGSDWCPLCIKQQNEVFSKQEFIKFAKDNFILLEVDFPEKSKLAPQLAAQNHSLAEKYKIKAFPVVVFLDKEGKFILKTGYRAGGCKSYISFLKIVKKLVKIYATEASLKVNKYVQGCSLTKSTCGK